MGRVVVSLLLPGSIGSYEWLILVRMKRHLWPMQMTAQLAAADIPTVTCMSRERRRLKTRYISETIDINWTLLGKQMMTSHPTGIGGTNSITGSF